MSADDDLITLLGDHHSGVVVTLKRDGRPQLSNVSYSYADGRIRVSITAGRAKTANLRRDPRVSFYVNGPGSRSYAVAEGLAQLSPESAEPNDATVDELVDIYRSIAGEHPDWDEFRAAMVDDRRVVLTIPVERVYGWNGR